MIKRIILAAVVVISAIQLSTMEVYADGTAPTPTMTVEQMQSEISRLKQENEALRRENQRLRVMLLEREQQNAVGQSDAGNKIAQPPASNESTDEYWLTTSSKKRHNSKCRNYKKTKGRPCTKDEGTPCKICGG